MQRSDIEHGSRKVCIIIIGESDINPNVQQINLEEIVQIVLFERESIRDHTLGSRD